MAKKSTTKKVKKDKMDGIIVDLKPIEELTAEDIIMKKVKSDEYVMDYEKPKMKHLSLIELQANESLLRMLVLHYEKMLRLDDVEGRTVMSENRNKYNRLSILHTRLLNYIENKLVKLEEYEWD